MRLYNFILGLLASHRKADMVRLKVFHLEQLGQVFISQSEKVMYLRNGIQKQVSYRKKSWQATIKPDFNLFSMTHEELHSASLQTKSWSRLVTWVLRVDRH